MNQNLPKTIPPKKSKRELSLDFVRGMAVLLMIVAHSFFFFHNESNHVLNSLARTGNTVCFVLFLFVSGSSLYFSLISRARSTKELVPHIIKRSIYFLIGFYLIAFMASFEQLQTLAGDSLLVKVTNILLLLDLPSFTEFMIPFILYTLSVIFLRKLYAKTSTSLLLTLELSYLFYLVAYALYPLSLPSPWREIKALFVGEQGLNSFPVFQYFPVLLLGFYWGHFLKAHPDKTVRDRKAFGLGLLTVGIVVLSSVLSRMYPLAILDPLNRWPPSVGFLNIGLATGFFVFILFTNLSRSGWICRVLNFIAYMGQDAFDLFIVHILLLYLYRFLWGVQYANPLIVSILFFCLLTFTVIISSLNWDSSPSIFRMGPIACGQPGQYRTKKKYLVGTVFFLALVFWNLNHNFDATTVGSSIPKDQIIGIEYRPLPHITSAHIRENNFKWYDDSYLYFNQVNIQNRDDFTPLEKGAVVEFSFDHEALVESNKVQADGKDIMVVYYTDNEYEPVNFNLLRPNSTDTTIQVALKQPIYPDKKDNRYFLYYGSLVPVERSQMNETAVSSQSYTIELYEEHSPALIAQLNRQWYLTSLPRNVQMEDLQFTVNVMDPEIWVAGGNVNAEDSFRYAVEGTTLSGSLTQVSNKQYQARLQVSALPVGEYRMYAYIDSESGRVETRHIPFYISEPVYVVWTMDWEGWDVSDAYLNSIAQQTERHYGIPITHFFNPRIYVEGVMSIERADYLTSWVRKRTSTNGDEAELHLHMFFDMVNTIFNGMVNPAEEPEEVATPPDSEGLYQPKTSPAWGFHGSGYDVYTTAYSYEDFSQMLKWAEAQFEQHGLTPPTGYRAGGWFADEKILRALDDQGFLFDSSGREQNMWNGAAKSPWNLDSTTQPYHPSASDQNVVGSDSLTLLEIPNNGADCYSYSAEDMKKRFYDNFDGRPQSEKKTVVYLSHAQWQNDDEKKMEEILDMTDIHLYKTDGGPVLYVTMGQLYDIWK